MSSFDELGLSPELLSGIRELGFEQPMPIQEEVIPHLLNHPGDLVGLAQTGTGKTAAFGLPLLQHIDTQLKVPQAAILCPTRELCLQITKELDRYAKYLKKLSVVAVYGGADIRRQIKSLRDGAQVVVATPGRLLDLIRRGSIPLDEVKTVVLDEADEMLNMGFREELDAILDAMPPNRNTHLFSATLPKEVAVLSKRYMSDPHTVTIGKRNAGADQIDHVYYRVHPRDRYAALRRIVDAHPTIYGIVFCRTRQDTREVAEKLIRDGYNADAIHGDLSQPQRDQVMNQFRKGYLQLLVATDVAARGIDVADLTHVIHYHLPDDVESYTHRSGRTGRAGNQGISVALIEPRETRRLRMIEKTLSDRFKEGRIPTAKEIVTNQIQHRISSMDQIDADHALLNEILPEITLQLNGLDRDELIKRFVASTYQPLLSFYESAPDLNTVKVRNKSDRSSKSRERNGRRPNKRDGRSGGSNSYRRLMMNIGKKDGLSPKDVIRAINDATIGQRVSIGNINIEKHFSVVEVDEQFASELGRSLNKSRIGRRKAQVQVEG